LGGCDEEDGEVNVEEEEEEVKEEVEEEEEVEETARIASSSEPTAVVCSHPDLPYHTIRDTIRCYDTITRNVDVDADMIRPIRVVEIEGESKNHRE
jgi:hypothetical protein